VSNVSSRNWGGEPTSTDTPRIDTTREDHSPVPSRALERFHSSRVQAGSVEAEALNVELV